MSIVGENQRFSFVAVAVMCLSPCFVGSQRSVNRLQKDLQTVKDIYIGKIVCIITVNLDFYV